MSDNVVINSVKFKIVNLDERVENMTQILKEAQEIIDSEKPKGLMVIFQNEYDDQYVYKYLSTGLKNTEKVSLLEFIKQLVMGGS